MARCRVCHRTMTNPAHIAAGVGPICARRAAAFGVGTGSREQAAYPAAKLARIERMLAKVAAWLEMQQAYRAAAYRSGTPEQQAQGEWTVRLATNWYGRWRMMQMRAQRLGQITGARSSIYRA